MNITKLSSNGNVVFNPQCFGVEEVGPERYAFVNHSLGLALSSFGNRAAVREHPESFLANRKTIREATARYDEAFGFKKTVA